MFDLDLVTVYNKEDMLNEMLESVQATAGELKVNVVALDNRNDKYKSASEAYNYAVRNLCETQIIIFCHQDIIFFEGAIKNYYNCCNKNHNCLFGAAGVCLYTDTISNMQQQRNGKRYDTLPSGGEKSVFTMDECLICGHKSIFEKVEFDEIVCDNWHFYTVDLCLQCHKNNIDVKVVDSNICHLSGGDANKSFYECERRVGQKYRKDYKIIKYTWGWSYTNPIKYAFQRVYRYLRYKQWNLK